MAYRMGRTDRLPSALVWSSPGPWGTSKGKTWAFCEKGRKGGETGKEEQGQAGRGLRAWPRRSRLGY